MARWRKVNLYGNRYVIELMKHDIDDMNLSIGQLVDIDETTITKEKDG